jgi:glutathione S-transferase
VHVTLYRLPGSHPCDAVEVALELKRIPFVRVDLLPLAQVLYGPLRWGGRTAPGMLIDGERLVGSRRIMRRLDELVPQPSLLPAEHRADVLDAEEWGDRVLQSVPRRIIDAAFRRRPLAMLSYAGGSRVSLPPAMQRAAAPAVAQGMALLNRASDRAARDDVAALPTYLRRIDHWIEGGLLGAEAPNAADLQIGATVRLLQSIADLRPLLEGHAAQRLAGYFGPLTGEVPAGTLPAAWLG